MVGLHVSIASSPDLAFDRAQELGATTFQIFTRNPNQWKFKPLADETLALFREKRRKSGFRRIVDHMPYLPNLASPDKSTMKISRYTLDEEVKRCDSLGIDYLVVHLGSHLGKGAAVGIANIAGACDQAIDGSEGKTMILLENMAGQKNSVGARFEEIRGILDRVRVGGRVGVCLDTCMPPGSLVLNNGIPSKIENVVVGDTVSDSSGNPTAVIRVARRGYAGDLISLKPAGLPWLTITPEHPLLCVSVNRIRYLEESPWRVKVTDSPTWVDAKGLEVGNFLLMPKLPEVPSTRIDFRPYAGLHSRYAFPLQMTLTEEMAELFGLYLAEGYTFLGEGLGVRGNDNGKVYLAFGKHERDLIARAIRLFEDVFGLKAWVDDVSTASKVCVGSNVLSRFFKKQFGPNARNKQIPSLIQFAPGNIIKAFVLGFLKGDGNVNEFGVHFVTSSEAVANGLTLLLLKLDIRATIFHHALTEGEIGRRKIHGSGWFVVSAGRSDSAKLGFKYHVPGLSQRTVLKTPNYFLVPIRHIQRTYYNGPVFNLTTAAGSFMAPLVVTHNCHLYAAGFDLGGDEAVRNTMRLFDEVIGFDRLKVVHLNDSKGALGSRLDRHEDIGKGKIGRKGIRAFLHYDGIRERPLVMETPYRDVRTMKASISLVRALLG